MRRVPPSMLVREDLEALLTGGVGEAENIVSALVDTVTRLVVQELLEAEQGDYLGGRGRYTSDAPKISAARAMAMSQLVCAPPKGPCTSGCPRSAGPPSPIAPTS
jgi:hypothetical protein